MSHSPHPHFSDAEFAERLAKLRARLLTADVELALFDEIEAMAWISGYGNSENRWRCVAVPVQAEPFFLIRALDAGPCARRSRITDIRSYRDWEDPFPVLVEAVSERGLTEGRIGLDFNSYGMSLARFAKLKASFPKASFVDIGPLVAELRLIKSPAEIELLRKASRIADESMLRVAAACRPGSAQRDAARVAVSSFVELGADPGLPGPISAGRGWDFLHAALEESTLATGDVVHIELIPSVGGYSARLMRCAGVGGLDPARQEAARILAAVQDEQIAAMQPGAVAADVDAILRDGLIRTGLRQSFDNISGYTLGFYHPAGPRTSDFTRIFHPDAEWLLEPGMVFHVYASAQSLSFSETVLITADGPERLTRLSREAIETF